MVAQKVAKGAPKEDSPAEELPETTLTKEESDEFRVLLRVGRVSKDYDFRGHSYTLRTLSTGEDLCIGQLVKPYLDTPSYGRAYNTAIVAAALRELDGEPLYEPFKKEDDLEVLRKKFDKVLEYSPIIVDIWYKSFIELEQQLIPLVSRLGKTSD